jgi:ATP-binding cassette subfamily B protein
MKDEKTYGDIALIRRILGQARPYWPHLIVIFLLGLLAAPLALLMPLPLTIAVDSVIGSEPLPGPLNNILPPSITESKEAILALVAMFVVVIALLSQLQILSNNLLRAYTGEKLTFHLRTDLFRHLQRLSLSFHDTRGTADSTYRIQYDTEAIRYLAIDGITPFVSAAFTLVAMMVVMFRLDWQLALVALAISPILFFIARLYRRQLRQQSKKVKRTESSALSVVQEVLTSMRVVLAFGQEEREQKRFEKQSSKGVSERLRYKLSEGSVGFLLGMTTALGTAIVLFLGVNHVLVGIITLGQLLLIMGYLAQLYSPLKTISRKATSLQSHLASAERAYSLLDYPLAVKDSPNGRPIKQATGSIEFQDVSFSYDGQQKVLEDISFSVSAGQRVGIVGETGAGKSTLMNLLTRFYDPNAGSILLDDLDLRGYKLADLRRQFAIVLQDTVLFSTSIAENIAYARPEASEDEIVAAARAANAHQFITQLPEGYDTHVGEKGMLLSGGERQRIALARAFLMDVPLLILDEPTSSVDMKTESSIIEAMERLISGRTTFMIAHRLTTLRDCDLLISIKDGKLENVQSDVSEAIDIAFNEFQENGKRNKNGSQNSRGRPLDIIWQESPEEIVRQLRQASSFHQRRRLKAFSMLRNGATLLDASETVGVSHRTMKRWISWYREGGLDELLNRKPGVIITNEFSSARERNKDENKARAKSIDADEEDNLMTKQDF